MKIEGRKREKGKASSLVPLTKELPNSAKSIEGEKGGGGRGTPQT